MIERNVSLRPYNTFGIDVNAAGLATFHNVEQLIQLLDEKPFDKFMILGGGSNVLYTSDYDGLVLINKIKGISIVDSDNEYTLVKAGAGEVWHEFVLRCIDQNLGGIENLSLIPGSVGASPMQNIGAYGVEIKDVFVELEALNIATKKIEVFKHEDCQFGYRESVFKRALKGQYVIINVTYRLTNRNHKLKTRYGAIQEELEARKINSPTIKEISDVVIAIRQSKLPDPKEIGNAGSFFKNPVVEHAVLQQILKKYPDAPNYPAANGKVKLAAGWLIDKAGWKGKTFDQFGVHKNQALVLVNYNLAQGSDIYQLSEKILQDVYQKFGVSLEREVNII
jgi:UDP-N-acetylmuramate dehydrogenase